MIQQLWVTERSLGEVSNLALLPVTKDRVIYRVREFKVTSNSNPPIKFGFGTDNYGALVILNMREGMMYITFIGYCSINDWKACDLQIEIRDYKISSTTSWYFLTFLKIYI